MIDAFNIIAGLVTILSLFFSLWLFMQDKKKESVEKEKSNSMFKKFEDLKNTSIAISNQTLLIAQLSDREETSKKELKHLSISLLSTVEAIIKNIDQEVSSNKKWSFGVPAEYFTIESAQKREIKKTGAHDHGLSDKAEQSGQD